MRLILILSMLVVPSVAVASPLEGPDEGTVTLAPQRSVRQPITMLPGEPTLILVTAEGGQIDCGMFTDDGQEIALDVDATRNSCAFRLTPRHLTTVILAIENNGDTSATVHAIAK